MDKIFLDFKNINNEKDMHDLFRKAFGFPYYYGENEHAFWDCIFSLDDTEIIIKEYNQILTDFRNITDSYIDLLFEYQIQCKNLKISFLS